jgi:hypothetical protein
VARRQPVFELRRTSAPHRAEPQPGAVTNPQTRR